MCITPVARGRDGPGHSDDGGKVTGESPVRVASIPMRAERRELISRYGERRATCLSLIELETDAKHEGRPASYRRQGPHRVGTERPSGRRSALGRDRRARRPFRVPSSVLWRRNSAGSERSKLHEEIAPAS